MIPDTAARNILEHALEIAVYSSVIYGMLLGFRAVFRRKAGPALRYGLWFLLLIRLTLPFTVSSSVHLIVLPAEQAEQPAAAEAVQTEQVPAGTPAVPSAARRPGQDAAVTEQREETPQPSAQAARRFRPGIWQILLLVWWAGSAAVCIRYLWIAALLRARLKRFGSEPPAQIREEFSGMVREMRIRGRVRLLGVQDIQSPALTIGLFPAVLLPESLSWPERGRDRALAFRHELTHLKRLDHLVMIWFGILRAVWWCFPVVWMMGKPFRMDMESACDAMVVRGMSRDEKLYYAGLLLELGKEIGI